MHPEVTSSLTPKAPILPRALFYIKVEKTPRKSSIVKTSANKSLGKNLNRNNVKLSLFILRMQLVYGTLVYIGGASFLLDPTITKPRLRVGLNILLRGNQYFQPKISPETAGVRRDKRRPK